MKNATLRLSLALSLAMLAACVPTAPAESDVARADVAADVSFVMFQDFANPADTSFELAWETAQRAPPDGVRDQVGFLHPGIKDGTEVRLLFARIGAAQPGDPDGAGALVAARTVVKPGLTVGWFADYTHSAGGIRVLPTGTAGVDGLPVTFLCGSINYWLEAGPADALIARSTNITRVTDPACFDDLLTTWD
jgi:hypothetical protein